MVDIVIVNWNSGLYLKKSLDSVLDKTNSPFVNRVLIVDNDSTDQSLSCLPAHEKITVVRNSGNAGFSRAANMGFKLCNTEYVLLLNPDAFLMENTLSDCIDFIQNRNDIDILGCRLIDENGTPSFSCSRFPSAKRIFFDAAGLSKIFPSLFRPAAIMTDWNHGESREVDVVIGAFMFIRTSVFSRIGFFDERFFVYYEEVDFSKRLADAGGRCFYNRDIIAIHAGGGSTRSVKDFRLFLNLQSRLRYAEKHFSYPGYLLVWISTFFIEPFTRTTHLLLKGRTGEIKDVLKGFSLLILKQDPFKAAGPVQKKH